MMTESRLCLAPYPSVVPASWTHPSPVTGVLAKPPGWVPQDQPVCVKLAGHATAGDREHDAGYGLPVWESWQAVKRPERDAMQEA